MLGHLHFAEAVLKSRPELALELDSQGFSPLHPASANGYTEMVKLLLSGNPDMCLAREEDGRTPLHVAVMRGRDDVIQGLVHVNPEAAQYTLDKGETLLNLAVKHNRLKTIKLLVELERDTDIVNIKERDGNSVLRTAVSLKRIETVKYLLNETAAEVNPVNQNGFTAFDIIANMPRDLKGMEIRESLLNAIALRSRRIPASESGITQFIEASEKPKVPVNSEAIAASGAGNNKKKHLKNDDRLNKKYDTLMVAASVIAAMAYQAGFRPPGGVWDHDSDYFHSGQSVLATYDSKLYSIFWIFNTVSFISSISTLFLLVSELPLKQRIYVWILTATMWVTLTSMVVTYIASMLTIKPDNEQTVQMVVTIAMLAWLAVIGIVFLAHTARFIYLDCPEAKKTHKEAAFLAQKREARSGSRQCLNTYIINIKFLSETKLANSTTTAS